jgi:hypothetical protein
MVCEFATAVGFLMALLAAKDMALATWNKKERYRGLKASDGRRCGFMYVLWKVAW